MALIKIHARPEKREELINKGVAKSIKLVAAAALNVQSLPTTPSGIETAFIEGIDLVGIDYIIEIIAVERPNQQQIAESFIRGLNQIYPDILFSVYFNNISTRGMANTPRPHGQEAPLTMGQAIKRSKNEV